MVSSTLNRLAHNHTLHRAVLCSNKATTNTVRPRLLLLMMGIVTQLRLLVVMVNKVANQFLGTVKLAVNKRDLVMHRWDPHPVTVSTRLHNLDTLNNKRLQLVVVTVTKVGQIRLMAPVEQCLMVDRRLSSLLILNQLLSQFQLKPVMTNRLLKQVVMGLRFSHRCNRNRYQVMVNMIVIRCMLHTVD